MTIFSPKISVAVLRGGPSHEYEDSLKTGAHVLSLLREMPEKFEPIDIFISKDGEWHLSGLVEEPHHAIRHADVVWNALHGSYGEDGQVQQLLEKLQVPFSGSSSLASALAMNKHLAKEAYLRNNLLIPQHEIISEGDFTDDRLIHIFRTYLHPVIIKPVRGSGSLGVSLAHSFHELKEKIKDAFQHFPKVMVEEHVKGKDISCFVVDKARGENLYALIPEGNLKNSEKKEIEALAKLAHEYLGLRHYSSSDFVVTPKGRIYLLETNSQPKFHADSQLHRSLQAVGWRARDFVDHIIKLAL